MTLREREIERESLIADTRCKLQKAHTIIHHLDVPFFSLALPSFRKSHIENIKCTHHSLKVSFHSRLSAHRFVCVCVLACSIRFPHLVSFIFFLFLVFFLCSFRRMRVSECVVVFVSVCLLRHVSHFQNNAYNEYKIQWMESKMWRSSILVTEHSMYYMC